MLNFWKSCPILGKNLTCSCCCCCFTGNYCFLCRHIRLALIKIIVRGLILMQSCLRSPVAGIGAKYWRPPPWSPQKLINSNFKAWSSCGSSKKNWSKGAGLPLVSPSWMLFKISQMPFLLPDTRNSFVAQSLISPFPLFLIRKPAISLEQSSTFIMKPCPSVFSCSANQ